MLPGDDLVRHMYYRHGGDKAAEATRHFFHSLGLPVPASGEFTTGQNNTQMVFLNDPGVVIRISDLSRRRPVHPNVLQPLGEHVAGGLRFAIDPGCPCPVVPSDMERMDEILGNDGIVWDDPYEYNAVYLPRTFDDQNDPWICAIDYDALGAAQKPEWLQREFPQDKIHGPLRDAFRRAWPEGAEKPEPELMREFWRACRQARREGLLSASWLFNGQAARNYKNACRGSLSYERHMQTGSGDFMPKGMLPAPVTG